MEQTMTIREVLEKTAEMLNNIPVPVGLADTVADPIRNAVRNLQACMNAMDAAEAKEETDGRAADPE